MEGERGGVGIVWEWADRGKKGRGVGRAPPLPPTTPRRRRNDIGKTHIMFSVIFDE